MEEATIRKLKKALPTGWSRIISERLAARGIEVSPRNVQWVVTGKKKKPHPDIEAELMKLLDEAAQVKKSEFEQRVEAKLAELEGIK